MTSRLLDVVDESVAGVAARPARLALTVLGTVLGIAALVATVGLAQTASGQISEQFNVVSATEVVVRPRSRDVAGTSQPAAALPWDGASRVARLNGVEAAATIADVGEANVRTVPVIDPGAAGVHNLTVAASSPDLPATLHATMAAGRWFDEGHDRRADRVAVIGAAAAEQLHLTRVATQPVVFVADQPLTVIGILDPAPQQIQLDTAVIIPQATAASVFGLEAPQQLLIRTRLGAPQLVAHQAPIALAPNNPQGFETDTPPTPDELRSRVQTDVNALFLLLGSVALVVGALGIANVTLLSVLERVGEIGLRRALGATRGQVARQFLAESLTTGTLGGLVGAALGIVTTVAVSAARSWTPLLDARLALAAPLLGGVIGLAAGTYPAWKAANLDPIEALRSGA